MSQGPTVFVADAALRLDAPPARPRDRVRPAVALLAAVALETAVFALIWFERPVVVAPELTEIPVELVAEPPPPPPPPPPQQRAPEPKAQEYEKPATDAPREGKSDHDDEHVAEKEKPAAAPPPPAPPSPVETPQAAAPPPPSPAPEFPKSAEAEAPPPVKAEPAPSPLPSPPPPKETPAPAKPSVLAALPKVFESVPDLDFGGAAIKSPVTGGAAKSTYLSMLYGLIVPRLHVPAVAHAYGRRLTGAIGLEVDGHGRLMQRFIVEASGSMELDQAAMEAVAAASRLFPPPPRGAPMGMKFTYSVE
jgi:protein TonB